MQENPKYHGSIEGKFYVNFVDNNIDYITIQNLEQPIKFVNVIKIINYQE
jgi:hypothetical protein